MLAGFAMLAALAMLAACDPPSPFAAYERVRDRACSCKDLACAEEAERALADAIDKEPQPWNASIRMSRAHVVAVTRRCMTAVWRERQPANLFSAETDTPPPNAPQSPCVQAYETAHRILTCDRTPLAHRTVVAKELISLRAVLNSDAAKQMSELALYDHCLGMLMVTMGVEDCR